MTKQTTQTSKWTYWRLTSQMRARGWQSMGQGSYGFTFADNRMVQVNLFALDVSGERKRELWHRYAEQQQAPEPEDFR